MKTNPVTNQQFFTLQVHIIAMETEFGAVFHDTSRPTQLSTFVEVHSFPMIGSLPVFVWINFSNRIAAAVLPHHFYTSRSPQPSNIAPITGAILKIHA
jgi:hypothetical protein